MKKYIQLQDSYDSKKGDIWEQLESFPEIIENTKTEERTSIKIADSLNKWFAPYEEKKEYAKIWENFENIAGYCVHVNSKILPYDIYEKDSSNKNVYATENQAKAALAEAQLSQLLKEIYEGEEWLPDWENNEQLKLCMCIRYGKVDITVARTFPRFFISLPTQELAEQFLKNHRELIETYFKKFEW